MILKQVSLLASLTLAGCASLEGKPTATSPCAFEQVWDTSIVALEGIRLQKADKDSGVLETNWVEVGSATRAGVMQRDVNKERVRYVVEVKREGPGVAATVLQLREAWSPMGVMMNRWRAVPGNPKDEEAVAAEIARRLKEKGC
ncbi:MAG: hypothetical protein AUI21_06690 [Nitrospirae bacterium 13_1_40CM_2_62_10]|nr:MAG: hypothetical protein AUI21_06690 [Nitrospirae bacterium 13_1_40CM_2_62_10]